VPAGEWVVGGRAGEALQQRKIQKEKIFKIALDNQD